MSKRLRVVGSIVLGSMLAWSGWPTGAVALTPPTNRPDHSSSFDPSSETDRHSALTPLQYAKGQFVVKFKPSLTACAHCLFAQGRRFQSALADSADSLDRLNQQVGVRAARGLFQHRHGLTTANARQQAQGHLQNLQARFAGRSRRASPEAALPDLTNVYVFEVPEGTDIAATCARYQADPHVEYAQPDYLATVQFVPNDPYYTSAGSWGQLEDDLWGLKKLQLESAWDLSQGQGMVVAVVDTGVDYTHPDLAVNIWVNSSELPANGLDDDGNGFVDDVRGWDFTTCAQFTPFGQCIVPKTGDNDSLDMFGHGTHVAGTIAAIGNNGEGIIGVAPQATVMPVQGLNAQGAGLTSDLAAAMVYAAQNGADVINNSWGCDGSCLSNPMVEDAVRTAHGLGAVVVFAAGNSGEDILYHSPQNMTNPKPIVVAASTPGDAPAWFTNWGFLLDVAAPGGGTADPPPAVDPDRNILSLKSAVTHAGMDGQGQLVIDGQYLRQSGTSMAAPHASGLAALVLARYPTFTNEEVRHVLRASADDVGVAAFDSQTGAGRLNASQALGVDAVLRADIASPLQGAVLVQQDGAVAITGTTAGTGFAQRALSYQPYRSAQAIWLPIGQPDSAAVIDGVLGSWSIQSLTPGLYALQVVATTQDARQFQDVVQVAIERKPSHPITTDPALQLAPAISGDRIVWEDHRNGAADIYLYDLATNTERRITTDPFPQSEPAISSDRIIWYDYRNGAADIYLYDLSTNTERRITTNAGSQLAPAISGDRIVWEDNRDGHWDIYLYDLSTNTERRITTDPASQLFPAISGDRIVWEDNRDGHWDIYLYDLSTNTERRITSDSAFQILPVISGDWIVWQDNRSGNWDIYLYDLATNTERQITSDPADQALPAIAGNEVVWTDERNGNADIYLYDLTTAMEEPVAVSFTAGQFTPDLSDGNIVWTETRSGNQDIYARVANYPPTLDPVSNQVIGVGKLLVFPIRVRDQDREVVTLSTIQRPPGSGFFPKGDVTQNLVLDAADQDRLASCVVGTLTCTPTQRILGDVASPTGFVPDGQLTVEDTQTVAAMLQEQISPSGDNALLDLLNTWLFLWTPTAADADASAYPLRIRAVDGSEASAETTVQVSVVGGALNLLTNGGFESGQRDWSGWGTHKRLTTVTAYTGTTAAEITSEMRPRRLSSEVTGITAGASYRVRGSMKVINGTARGLIELQWRKFGGGLIRTDIVGQHVGNGNLNWVRLSSPALVAPPLAAKLEIGLVADNGLGTVYFDTIRLEPGQ